MNSYLTDDFIAHFRTLSDTVKAQARKNYQLWRRNPAFGPFSTTTNSRSSLTRRNRADFAIWVSHHSGFTTGLSGRLVILSDSHCL